MSEISICQQYQGAANHSLVKENGFGYVLKFFIDCIKVLQGDFQAKGYILGSCVLFCLRIFRCFFSRSKWKMSHGECGQINECWELQCFTDVQ